MTTLVVGEISKYVETKHFEVSAQWMKDTGKGEYAKVFAVLKEYRKGVLTFVDVKDGDKVWTIIADWRGKFV